MSRDFLTRYLFPGFVYAGNMVGVGFLALPYISWQTGIWLMLGYFVVLTAVTVGINAIFCDISLKTPDAKRFPGFVGYYLGKPAKIFVAFSFIFVVLTTLLVYVIIGGQFLAQAFGNSSVSGIIFASILYFLTAGYLVFSESKFFTRAEFWLLSLFIVVLAVVFVIKIPAMHIQAVFFQPSLSFSKLFLPFGPLLFSLWGLGLIPQMEDVTQKKDLKKIITVTTIAVSVLYLLFTIGMLALTNGTVNPIALLSLSQIVSPVWIRLILLAGTAMLLGAFMVQGAMLKEIFIYDLGIKPGKAFLMTVAAPLVLFLLGVTSFLGLISFVGGIFLALDGIFVLLMYQKIGGKSKWMLPLAVVLGLGMVYQIIYLFI